MGRRHFSLLLLLVVVLGPLAAVVVVTAGENKDTKRKDNGPASADDPKAALLAAYPPGAKKGDENTYYGVFVKPTKDGKCPDGSSDFFTPTPVNKQMEHNAEMGLILEGTRKERMTLEYVKIDDKPLWRVGCGTYYLMTVTVKDHYTTGNEKPLEERYQVEYFVSDYDRHLNFWFLDEQSVSKENLKARIQPNESLSKRGECQDPSVHKYEEIEVTKEVVGYANEAVLQENLQNKSIYGFVTVDKVKKRPGCGMYYRVRVVGKDHDSGKEETFDYQYYQNRAGIADVSFQSAIPL